jgi:transcriptional regulator with XRE-family HTH domain
VTTDSDRNRASPGSGSPQTRIRQSRLHARLPQRELARLVGVHRSAVAQWEAADGSTPTAENLARIAVATGVQFEWLATGRGRMRFVSDIADDLPGAAALLNYAAHDETEARALMALRRFAHRDVIAFVEMLEAVGGHRAVRLSREIPFGR